MVLQDVSFSDGTRIFYEEENGSYSRYIEFGSNSQKMERIKKNPKLKDFIDTKTKKVNAGKFFYLGFIQTIASRLDDNQKKQLYNDIKKLHDRASSVYDSSLLNQAFLSTFGKYMPNHKIKCAAVFVAIYLAMIDLEDGKVQYPHSLGKTMVLMSCETIIFKHMDYRLVANMFKRKPKKTLYDDELIIEDYIDEEDSPYAKYNGFNGFDDDTIDIAFDGIPEATWNVD